VWNIRFDLPAGSASGTGEATLTAAIASADRARVTVLVNGKRAGEIVPKVQGGNALVRHGIHAKYCVEYVTFPVSMLQPRGNVISLVFPPNKSPQPHVMYDYLNLELP
jgi:rhamnogalacturonan endolyase